MKKQVVTVVYGIGVIAVVALVCMFISHSTYIPFPDTMIPATLYELATEWLALGTLPMLIACFLMKKTYAAKGKSAALIFVPSVICAAALIFWVAVMIIGVAIM